MANLIKRPAPAAIALLKMVYLKPMCQEHLWPILEGLDPADIKALILLDKPFHSHLPQPWLNALHRPEVQSFAQYAPMITDQDLLDLMPPDIVNFITSDDKGAAWLHKEFAWLRWQLTGQGQDPWAPPTKTFVPMPAPEPKGDVQTPLMERKSRKKGGKNTPP